MLVGLAALDFIAAPTYAPAVQSGASLPYRLLTVTVIANKEEGGRTCSRPVSVWKANMFCSPRRPPPS